MRNAIVSFLTMRKDTKCVAIIACLVMPKIAMKIKNTISTMSYYYSLKTEKEEHCLELNIDGSFDYAVYDLQHNLLSEKTLVKKEDVVEFIYKTQQKLDAKFEKIELEQPKEEVPEKETVQEESASVSEKPYRKIDENTRVFKDGVRKTQVFEREASKDESLREYEIKLKVNLDTKEVTMEVTQSPTGDKDSRLAKDTNTILGSLFKAFVVSMPDLLASFVICGGAKHSQAIAKNMGVTLSMEQAMDNSKQAFKESNGELTMKSGILDMLGDAVKSYKN